jgi:hypothetical protein
LIDGGGAQMGAVAVFFFSTGGQVMERMTRRTLLWMLPFLFVALSSCASATGSRSSPMGDTDIIARADIADSRSASNAYDLILALRPLWLQTRGLANLRQAAGEEGIVVYMDNARLGDIQTLRRVPLGSIQYLEHFSAPEATQRWGGGHIHGAILVSTQRR